MTNTQIEITKRIADAAGIKLLNGGEPPLDEFDTFYLEEINGVTYPFNPFGSMNDALLVIHALLPDITEMKFVEVSEGWEVHIWAKTLTRLVHSTWNDFTADPLPGKDKKEALCLFANETAKTMELPAKTMELQAV